jgi:hypothetical protein
VLEPMAYISYACIQMMVPIENFESTTGRDRTELSAAIDNYVSPTVSLIVARVSRRYPPLPLEWCGRIEAL